MVTGIAQGRVVRYVMLDGSTRAAIISDVTDHVEGVIDLVYFRTSKDIILPIINEARGVRYDVVSKSPLTWHFPERS